MTAKDQMKNPATDGPGSGMIGGTIGTEEMTGDIATAMSTMRDVGGMTMEGETEMVATGEGIGLPTRAMSLPRRKIRKSKKLRLKKC